jgi:hypothetical protein
MLVLSLEARFFLSFLFLSNAHRSRLQTSTLPPSFRSRLLMDTVTTLTSSTALSQVTCDLRRPSCSACVAYAKSKPEHACVYVSGTTLPDAPKMQNGKTLWEDTRFEVFSPRTRGELKVSLRQREGAQDAESSIGGSVLTDSERGVVLDSQGAIALSFFLFFPLSHLTSSASSYRRSRLSGAVERRQSPARSRNQSLSLASLSSRRFFLDSSLPAVFASLLQPRIPIHPLQQAPQASCHDLEGLSFSCQVIRIPPPLRSLAELIASARNQGFPPSWRREGVS